MKSEIQVKVMKVHVRRELLISKFEPGPLFFEIKSPLQNLGICVESKKVMLLFRALAENNDPQAFLSLYYSRLLPQKYKHPLTKRIMNLKEKVLIGEDLWNNPGGKGIYNELLSIIQEISSSLLKYSRQSPPG